MIKKINILLLLETIVFHLFNGVITYIWIHMFDVFCGGLLSIKTTLKIALKLFNFQEELRQLDIALFIIV